jgi:hypothetical protein
VSNAPTSLLSSRGLPFDPVIALATTLESQKGVYALLIGSGASTGVGIPTGWGVVEALVRKLALASQTEVVNEDWEAWWAGNAQGRELGYSSLIESIAPTAASRRALMSSFFEPSDEDRADGLKVPGAAHKAIAKLVARGAIRVIVTTNFDRLLEQAIEAEGILPQVITSESAVGGMEPLQHAPVTIVKLHGDYGSLDQRNTETELSSYAPGMTALLERILDEYGLIISGWSGDWDRALATAIERTASRRYPLYWTVRDRVSDLAKRVTARSGSQIISNTTAETFFPDLLSRVEAVSSLAETPASLEVKLARLRRALPDPVRHLEVRDLFVAELETLSLWASEREPVTAYNDPPGADAEYDHLYSKFEPLFRLYLQGVLLDRDKQHSDLWLWVLQQAMNVRKSPNGPFLAWWDHLQHYPAFMLLRVGIMAAISTRHEDVIVRLLTEPRWASPSVQQAIELPAREVLHLRTVLNDELNQDLPRWITGRPLYPSSHLVRAQLQGLAVGLEGQTRATKLLDRLEYRLALGHLLPRSETEYLKNPVGGDYLGSFPFHDGQDFMEITDDFLARGDVSQWMRKGETKEAFASRILHLDEFLKRLRREF